MNYFLLKSGICYILFVLVVTGCSNDNSYDGSEIVNLNPTATLYLADTTCIKILYLGDLDFGESYQDNYVENILLTKGYTYSFNNIQPLLKNSDFIIANLETSLIPFDSVQVIDLEKEYLHYSDSVFAPLYLKEVGIDLVSLANNHTFDFGIKGLQDTERLLHSKNIATFGSGDDNKSAAMPVKLSLQSENFQRNIYVFAAYQYSKEYDKKYSFFAKREKPGVNVLSVKNLKKQIQLIKDNDPTSFVIVFPHWGNNYKWKNRKQNSLSKGIISAGADLIIGHGAHRIQEIENVNNKLVLYSLGNSVFNSLGRYQEANSIQYSILVSLELNTNSIILKCYPILSDNKITGFQPRFLVEEEVADLIQILRNKSKNEFPNCSEIQKDDLGFYIEIPVYE